MLWMNSSRAPSSPALTRSISSRISLAGSMGSFAVSTPQISTLFMCHRTSRSFPAPKAARSNTFIFASGPLFIRVGKGPDSPDLRRLALLTVCMILRIIAVIPRRFPRGRLGASRPAAGFSGRMPCPVARRTERCIGVVEPYVCSVFQARA